MKVYRHTKSNHGVFSTPDGHFSHVHNDIADPLPTFNEHSYILTMINRFNRWPSAHAIKDNSAENIAKIFIECFVIPNTITTDRGQQFQLALFQEKTLGTTHIKTTAYNPCTNGLMERFHRQLKTAPDPTKWSEYLMTVLQKHCRYVIWYNLTAIWRIFHTTKKAT